MKITADSYRYRPCVVTLNFNPISDVTKVHTIFGIGYLEQLKKDERGRYVLNDTRDEVRRVRRYGFIKVRPK